MNKKCYSIICLVMVFGLLFLACDNNTTTRGSIYAGSIYAGRMDSNNSQSEINRNIIDGIDYGDFPVDNFSIQIDYLVARSTNSSFMGWGILDYNNRDNQRIPITSQLRMGDLGSLTPQNGITFLDYIGFDIQILKDGVEIANFPESMFIRGEELAFYQNPGSEENANNMVLMNGWKKWDYIFNKYPLVPDLDWDQSDGSALWDDFVVIPFEGIDLTRSFDLKFEWDLSILVGALKDAYDNAGDYSAIQNRESQFFKDFFHSFALDVVYNN